MNSAGPPCGLLRPWPLQYIKRTVPMLHLRSPHKGSDTLCPERLFVQHKLTELHGTVTSIKRSPVSIHFEAEELVFLRIADVE